MDAVVLAMPLGIAIGLVVGAIGGGGAILALPVLVYVLGEAVGAGHDRLTCPSSWRSGERWGGGRSRVAVTSAGASR